MASAVGRLSVKIFGMADGPGETLAYHLGRALQLTNILRDLDEDAAMGRLYLPREALAAAGIATRDPKAVVDDPRIDAACRWVAAKAHEQYAPPTRCWRRARRAHPLAAADARGLSADPARDGGRGLGAAAPARSASARRRLLWIVLRHGLVD